MVFTLPSGERIRIRPLAAADKEHVRRGLLLLSPRSRWLRFHGGRTEYRESDLDRIVQPDGVDRFAVCAILLDEHGAEKQGIGLARAYREASDSRCAEVAIAVLDDWQGQGIGTRLMAALAESCRRGGIEDWIAYIADENPVAVKLVEAQGRVLSRQWHSGSLELKVDIRGVPDVVGPTEGVRTAGR